MSVHVRPEPGLVYLLVVLSIGCHGSWEERECTEDEQDFLAAAVELVAAVEGSVPAILEQRLGEETVPFSEIVDELVSAHEGGRIRCATFDQDSVEWETGAAAHQATRIIAVNVESHAWTEGLARWSAARHYAAYSYQEVEERIASGTYEVLVDMKTDARGTLYEPTIIAGCLAHEAAHLATGLGHTGDAVDVHTDAALTDFIVEVGLATRRAIYWDVWLPESNHLTELFVQTHPP